MRKNAVTKAKLEGHPLFHSRIRAAHTLGGLFGAAWQITFYGGVILSKQNKINAEGHGGVTRTNEPELLKKNGPKSDPLP